MAGEGGRQSRAYRIVGISASGFSLASSAVVAMIAMIAAAGLGCPADSRGRALDYIPNPTGAQWQLDGFQEALSSYP
jgi:hypothetical protein